jgi:hypothetical protein
MNFPHHVKPMTNRLYFSILIVITALTAVIALLLWWSHAAASSHANQPSSSVVEQATYETIFLFHANLTGSEEVPPVETSATGRFVMALEGDTVYYRLMAKDIDGVTMAHVHIGARGVNGPVSRWLYDVTGINAPGGPLPVHGTFTLTPDLIDDLMGGNLYVNLHTSEFPGGEIRGQLTPFDPLPTQFNALMTPDQEVPHDVESDALGVARLVLDDIETLLFEMVVTDIANITAAHIHTGWPSEAGPPVHWLYDVTGSNAPGGPFGPGDPVSGSVTLAAEDLVDLLTGYYYINVHTEDYPAGEIRGQIGGVNVFEAALTGAAEVPPVFSAATGKSIMALDADAETLYYWLLVHDIGEITMAHIHRGSPGVNGPVVHWLWDPGGVYVPAAPLDPQNPYTNELTLSDDDIFDLLRGDFYVNVHTSTYPAGEIRGQITPKVPSSHFNALMTPDQEAHLVDSEAVGLTRFTLDSALDVLHFDLYVQDLDDITMAHIHTGWPGDPGPVVHWLYDLAGVNAPGGPFDDDNPVGGAVMLNARDIIDLLSGYYHVNVHTEAYPAGEIRGQIGGVQTFHAPLSGDQEVPPVDTDASGMSLFALSADTTTLSYRLMVSDIDNITMAHIHLAPPGVNGPVVHWLYDPTGAQAPGGVFDPDNPVAGSLTFTSQDIFNLLAGDYYVNVHTEAHPDGEIRGQIMPLAPEVRYLARLSGNKEVPPVETEASGLTNFTFYPQLDTLFYFVQVTDLEEITMAHIHTGWPNENGPPVHWLYHAEGLLGPGGDFDSQVPIGGYQNLDNENLVDLLSGYYYVNVHTEIHPAGEIRGQIEPWMRIHLPILFSN